MTRTRFDGMPRPHQCDTEDWRRKARRLCAASHRRQAADQLMRVLDEIDTLHPNSEHRKSKVATALKLLEEVKRGSVPKPAVVSPAAPPANSWAGRQDQKAGIQLAVADDDATKSEVSLLRFTSKCLADSRFTSKTRRRCLAALEEQVSRIKSLDKGSSRHARAIAHLLKLLEDAGATIPPSLERFQQRSITRRDLEQHAKEIGGKLVFRAGPFQGPRPLVLRGANRMTNTRTRRWRLRRFPSGQTRKPGSHRSETW